MTDNKASWLLGGKDPKIIVKFETKQTNFNYQFKDPTKYENVECIGQLNPDAQRVFCSRSALNNLHEHTSVSKEKQVEVAGMLIGNVFVDEVTLP